MEFWETSTLQLPHFDWLIYSLIHRRHCYNIANKKRKKGKAHKVNKYTKNVKKPPHNAVCLVERTWFYRHLFKS